MQEIRKSNRYQQEFLTKVTLSLKKLSELEMKVFKLSVYDNYSDEDIGEELGYCIDNIRIIKKSSFIKFLVSLGADYDCYN